LTNDLIHAILSTELKEEQVVGVFEEKGNCNRKAIYHYGKRL